MKVTEHVYGLPLEVSLGDREMTINPVAVETPQGLLLLDVGLPGGVEVLSDALEAEGLALEDTWAVVVTHQDLDHAGCLAAIVDRTDAVVFAHEKEAPYLEGDEELVKSSSERPMEIEPVTVDVQLSGGEVFATDAGPMDVVFTPGHSPGHTSYYVPAVELLISADALNVVDGQLVGPREDATPDIGTAWKSVETLSNLDVAHTYCFHGGYVEAGTSRMEELLTER